MLSLQDVRRRKRNILKTHPETINPPCNGSSEQHSSENPGAHVVVSFGAGQESSDCRTRNLAGAVGGALLAEQPGLVPGGMDAIVESSPRAVSTPEGLGEVAGAAQAVADKAPKKNAMEGCIVKDERCSDAESQASAA